MGRVGMGVAALVVALGSLPVAGGDSAPPPEAGLWLTEESDARIRVHACDAGLCGEVVWMAEPYADDGTDKRDIFNPDESLRDRRVQGLRILEVRRKDDGRWAGTIYDPNEGKTYHCRVQLDGDDGDRLKIRGYVGIPLFGRSTYWTRADGAGE